MLKKFLDSLQQTFSDPDWSFRINDAIAQLDDPHCNINERALGIQSLGERASSEDLERLALLSRSEIIPEYEHEWIAEAVADAICAERANISLVDQLGQTAKTLVIKQLAASRRLS